MYAIGKTDNFYVLSCLQKLPMTVFLGISVISAVNVFSISTRKYNCKSQVETGRDKIMSCRRYLTVCLDRARPRPIWHPRTWHCMHAASSCWAVRRYGSSLIFSNWHDLVHWQPTLVWTRRSTTAIGVVNCILIRLAAWRSGNRVGRINEVTLRRSRLVLGWVTCPGSTPGGGTLFRYV